MTTYPLAQLVDAPNLNARVRFDFHASDGGGGKSWSNNAEWSWQPGALLGDPDGIGSDYGLGRLDLTLYIQGDRARALRTMGALARELQRDENYLLFRLSAASAPMWLRIFKPSPGALTFPYIDPRAGIDTWALPVSLPTEATAMGEQITQTVTIGNDPASGGLVAVLPEIKGDAPAPLVVEVNKDTGVASGGSGVIVPALYVAAVESWPGLPVWQAESGTLGTDAAVTADVFASGGSKVRVSFASDTSEVSRLSFANPPQLPGRWMVWGRLQPGLSPITVKGGGNALVAANKSTFAGTNGAVVPIGEFAFPRGNIAPRGFAQQLGALANSVRLVMARVAGTSYMDVDFLFALPSDLGPDAHCYLLRPSEKWSDSSMTISSLSAVLDGETSSVYMLDRSTTPPTVPAQPATGARSFRGSFPKVHPGLTNVLGFIPEATTAGTIPLSALTGTFTLTLSYRPRYVYLPSD